MKILFDHQYFSIQKYGGITRYFANLNDGLNKQPGVDSSISVLYSENVYLNPSSVPLKNTFGKKIFSGHRNRIIRWNRRYSELLMKLGNYDIFHPTYYNPYFISKNSKPFVVTVHDMIHETLPHIFNDAAEVIAQKKQVLDNADAIIAISEYTKQQIIKYRPQVESKISVVHHGYVLNADAAATHLALPRQYILFVGERWHYKNFNFFLTAIAEVLLQNQQLGLICAGGGAFTEEEIRYFDELRISSQCRQLNATDAELKQLYTQATVFAFPSLQEGFGLPLLEAFANGCPVLCSDVTCFPEIAGEAALYFDPANSASILSAIKEALNSHELRQQLVTKGHQRLLNFTFNKCIANTIQVYNTLLKSH